ncbi:TfoX/Sxy family protein [Nocardioides xinjiangensis]|uniref:TfoX/Sxy family protein n=1 Tax=Nocardioides xinjiangensis TaxID=2817376 RepID=UPI001B305305|nr:TfoX/Sxy family protein [Nocardioides sp. SYSU D00778]
MPEGYRSLRREVSSASLASARLLWSMAYDEALAQRIHHLLEGEPGLTSRKMFGGLGFMLDGRMAVAAGGSGSLMVRVDPSDGATWVDGAAVAPMEMRGRALDGWLLVSRDALASDEQLRLWVDRGVAFVRALPPR